MRDGDAEGDQEGATVVGVLVGFSVLSQQPRYTKPLVGQHCKPMVPMPISTHLACNEQSPLAVGLLDGLVLGDKDGTLDGVGLADGVCDGLSLVAGVAGMEQIPVDDGLEVGAELGLDGDPVGDSDGLRVGLFVGFSVCASVGDAVDGLLEGLRVGLVVDGSKLGLDVGNSDGTAVGT